MLPKCVSRIAEIQTMHWLNIDREQNVFNKENKPRKGTRKETSNIITRRNHHDSSSSSATVECGDRSADRPTSAVVLCGIEQDSSPFWELPQPRLGGRIRDWLERVQPRQLVLGRRIKRILRIWIRLWPIILGARVDRLIGIGRVTIGTGRGITTSRRSVFAGC